MKLFTAMGIILTLILAAVGVLVGYVYAANKLRTVPGADLYNATVVENSLANKDILSKVRIEKTWQDGDWTLHRVLVGREQIPDLAKALATGPWYIHLWQTGSDEVTVVFKDKIFTIKYSDKSTWVDAVAYGKSIGIPEEQLDFVV